MTDAKGGISPGIQFLHDEAVKAIEAGQVRVAIGWLVAMRLCALLKRESGDG